jgi:hypothetical protein
MLSHWNRRIPGRSVTTPTQESGFRRIFRIAVRLWGENARLRRKRLGHACRFRPAMSARFSRTLIQPTLCRPVGTWVADLGNDGQRLKEFAHWPTLSRITGGNDGSQGQAPLVRRSRDRGIDRDCLCGWLVWRDADTSATAVRAIVILACS